MCLKQLLGVAILGVAGVSAHAVGPGALGAIDNSAVAIGNTIPTKGWFNDEYDFSLTDPGLVGGFLTELNAPPSFIIGAFNLLLLDSAFNIVGADTKPTDGFSFAGLAAGSYTLVVQGKANGKLGGAYGGVVYAETSPVPEPETYALMLAGVGLIGFVARRRAGARG